MLSIALYQFAVFGLISTVLFLISEYLFHCVLRGARCWIIILRDGTEYHGAGRELGNGDLWCLLDCWQGLIWRYSRSLDETDAKTWVVNEASLVGFWSVRAAG
jgi:hypothetical protein